MSEAQVRARLGRPDFTRVRRLGLGSRFAELRYESGYFIVGLLGRPGRQRVHSVGTLQRSERTPQGFGVGTREARLARAYGGRLRCQPLRSFRGGPLVANKTRDCVLGRGSGAETLFVTAIPPDVSRGPLYPHEWGPNARVIEVRVRRGPLPG